MLALVSEGYDRPVFVHSPHHDLHEVAGWSRTYGAVSCPPLSRRAVYECVVPVMVGLIDVLRNDQHGLADVAITVRGLHDRRFRCDILRLEPDFNEAVVRVPFHVTHLLSMNGLC